MSAIAREAGQCILSHYGTPQNVTHKADASPVTRADIESHDYITAALETLLPGVTVISEEGHIPKEAPEGQYWLVDPLDGTRSFLRGHGEFVVNICLMEHHRPLLGVIGAPLHDTVYAGGDGAGAIKIVRDLAPERIATRRTPDEGMTLLLSHSGPSPKVTGYLKDTRIHAHLPLASAYKFCKIAEGVADIYARFGPTMEWDTAAGHALLLGAGGDVAQPDGQTFCYGKLGFRNGPFVATGKRDWDFGLGIDENPNP